MAKRKLAKVPWRIASAVKGFGPAVEEKEEEDGGSLEATWSR